jgi:hypothetical protein
VRALALKWLAEGSRPVNTVDLLVHNYQEGDYELIGRLVQQDHGPDMWEALGIAIREVFEAHPSAEAAPILLTLYEQGYCTMCRCSVVECLLTLGPLSDGMIDECHYDANKVTRKTVAELDQPEPLS